MIEQCNSLKVNAVEPFKVEVRQTLISFGAILMWHPSIAPMQFGNFLIYNSTKKIPRIFTKYSQITHLKTTLRKLPDPGLVKFGSYVGIILLIGPFYNILSFIHHHLHDSFSILNEGIHSYAKLPT